MTESSHGGMILTAQTLGTQFAEAYRTLLANISFSSIDRSIRTIMVTSAGQQEGKTTTVANLGVVMAQSGLRVLVVDADFRRPSLHLSLPVAPNGKDFVDAESVWATDTLGHIRPGLSNLIGGSATFVEAICPTDGFENLSLIPAGAIPPNPAQLMGSQRMRIVMQDLRERADIVLVDTPPARLYSDALVLCKMCDALIYVVRSRPIELLAHRRILKQLQQTPARLLGIVINDVEVDAPGDYSRNPRGDRRRE